MRLSAIDTCRCNKALAYDAAANNKIFIHDATTTPVTSPPIAAFGVDRSPFVGLKSTDIDIESFLCFDRAPMSVDGGEYLRHHIFSELEPAISADGGEFCVTTSSRNGSLGCHTTAVSFSDMQSSQTWSPVCLWMAASF